MTTQEIILKLRNETEKALSDRRFEDVNLIYKACTQIVEYLDKISLTQECKDICPNN